MQKKLLINVFKVSLAVILLWVLVRHSLLNFKLLFVVFNKPYELLLVFALTVLNIMLSAWRWYRLNTIQDFDISYKNTFLATYCGLTFNSLLPGSVGGDLVRISYLFNHKPKKKLAGALSVIADRMIGLLGVFFTLSLIGLFYKDLFLSSTYLTLFLTFCEWMSVIAIGGMLFLLFFGNISIPRQIKNNYLREKLTELALVIRIYRKAPWIILECIGISIAIQFLLAIILVVISHLLEIDSVAFLHYTIANLITQLVSLIPISPGSFGVGELAFGKTVLQLNPNSPAAYATIYLAYRIINMVFCMPGIVIFLKSGSFSKAKRVDENMMAPAIKTGGSFS